MKLQYSVKNIGKLVKDIQTMQYTIISYGYQLEGSEAGSARANEMESVLHGLHILEKQMFLAMNLPARKKK